MIKNTSLESVSIEILTYDQSYVAFLDILGFRNCILGPESEEIASVYKSTIDECLEKSSEIYKKHGFDFKAQIMSDSIVIAMTPNSNQPDEHINILKCLSMAICSIQFHLAVNDLWLRGGVSYGKCKFAENFVFGPALIAAIELEKIASYPRVIFDKNIGNNIGSGEMELASKINGPSIDEEWVYSKESGENALSDFEFINYAVFLHHPASSHKYVTESSKKIADFVKKGINRLPFSDKYIWTSKYLSSINFQKEVKEIFKPNLIYIN